MANYGVFPPDLVAAQVFPHLTYEDVVASRFIDDAWYELYMERLSHLRDDPPARWAAMVIAIRISDSDALADLLDLTEGTVEPTPLMAILTLLVRQPRLRDRALRYPRFAGSLTCFVGNVLGNPTSDISRLFDLFARDHVLFEDILISVVRENTEIISLVLQRLDEERLRTFLDFGHRYGLMIDPDIIVGVSEERSDRPDVVDLLNAYPDIGEIGPPPSAEELAQMLPAGWAEIVRHRDQPDSRRQYQEHLNRLRNNHWLVLASSLQAVEIDDFDYYHDVLFFGRGRIDHVTLFFERMRDRPDWLRLAMTYPHIVSVATMTISKDLHLYTQSDILFSSVMVVDLSTTLDLVKYLQYPSNEVVQTMLTLMYRYRVVINEFVLVLGGQMLWFEGGERARELLDNYPYVDQHVPDIQPVILA